MKSWKNVIIENIANLDNAKRAKWEASKGKKNRRNVRVFNNTKRLEKLVYDIKNGQYIPQQLKVKTIWDNSSKKERIISCPAFRDQIVHWMLMNILKPHIEKHIIKHAVANIPGRGLEYGRKLLQYWTHSDKKGTKWVLKLDIKKYYPSIDIDILILKLKKHIKDERVINLIRTILGVSKGLTLGSYFNQWAAIFYLSDFDHYVKEVVKCKYYLRYVDDMILFFPSKRKALKALCNIEVELNNLNLEIKRNGKGSMQIFKLKGNFVDALGYRTYRDGKQNLRRRNYISIMRLYNKISKNGCSRKQALSLLSKRGLVIHSDCFNLLCKIDKLIKKYHLKEIAYEKYY